MLIEIQPQLWVSGIFTCGGHRGAFGLVKRQMSNYSMHFGPRLMACIRLAYVIHTATYSHLTEYTDYSPIHHLPRTITIHA